MAFSARKGRYTDNALNRFKKTNLFFETNPYIIFQDPTYLGFKLFFLVDQPDSKLLSRVPLPNTAMKYLESIGDTARMYYLRKFVDHLININNQTPWFFQSIEGLQEAWKRGYQEDEFKPILPKERKIGIQCLESIDLRITALIDLYRKACFDWPNRREVVPKNLRQFTIYVYCYENRTINVKGQPKSNALSSLKEYASLPEFNQRQVDQNKILLGMSLNELDGAKTVPSLSDITESAISGIESTFKREPNADNFANNIDDDINRILFKFDLCEWLPDESGVIGAKVSNIIGEPANQTIAFSYRNVYEENIYNLFSGIPVTDLNYILDQAALDSPISELDKNLKTKFGDVGGFDMQSVLNGNFNSLRPFASLAADRLTEAIGNQSKSLLLGNIYGISTANVAGAAQSILTGDPNNMLQGVQRIVNMGGGASMRNNTNVIQNDPNVFDINSPSLSLRTVERQELGSVFGEDSPSLGNDDGKDSRSEGTANPEASLSNDNGRDSTPQGTGNPEASLSNDKGKDSTPQGTGNPTASLSNDDGPDSTPQ
jgi:hypothetical protein